MRKKVQLIIIYFTIGITSFLNAQYTQIPDANFEAALVTLGYDTVSGDGQVLTANIENLTTLTIQNANVTDLSGIEGFTSLETLDVQRNSLSTINLSNNLELTNLFLGNNDFTSLDISMLTKLESLNIFNNDITSLNVLNNSNLRYLNCTNNNLTSLDVTNLVNIESINCYNNRNFTTLILSGAVNVADINLAFTSISSIDLNDTVNLVGLYLTGTDIINLDLRNNVLLERLDITSNNLTSIDIRNGNNQIISSLNIVNNPSLSCVSVDEVSYAVNNFNADSNTTFTTDCNSYIYIADANFENALYNLGLDDIQNDYQVPILSISSLQSLDVSNSNITSLQGIENFTSLTTLDVGNNNIQSIDLSANTSITSLDVSNNSLGVLDASQLVNLTSRLLGAGEIWINGKKHVTLGKISQNGTDEIPYGQIIYTELPQEENLDILLVVSGHNSRLGGGPALQNVIQTKSLSTANQKSNPLIEGVITFLIIIFGVFQIYWFFTFNKELYFLYFGLFCLIGVSRQLFVGETLIYSFFPNISFGIVQRMRYVGYFGGLSLIILYYSSLYPGYVKKNLVRAIYLIPVLGILYVLFTPVFYGTLIAPFFQVYGLATMLLGFYIISCAIKNKKPYAKWVLLILVVQVVVFTNDILTAMMVIQTKFVINYSFLCYIIFHVFLNHKFQSEKERLLNQLYSNIDTLKSDIDYKIEEIETLKKDTFQQIKSKERMVDNLKKVAAADEKVSIQSLIADLKSELLEDTQLVSIKNDIEGINKDFVQRIKKIHPNLTKTDLEICMYIRLSLERKEIARLRYTTVAAVKKSRYRLRKKLELEVEDDLEKYLKSI